MAEANTNAELIDFLQNRRDTVCEALQRAFVAEYPRAKANVLESHTITEWTENTIDEFIRALQADDASWNTYRDSYGTVLEDPYEPTLTLFASYLSTILFMSRHTAPLIVDYYRADGVSAHKAIDQLESFAQRAIRENCALFTDEMTQPRALSRTWRLTGSSQPAQIPSDTPAHRYMNESHYARIVESMFEPAGPKGDALTPREKDVLALVMKGRSNAEIAQALDISESTVKKHVSHLFDKYNVFSRTELLAAVRQPASGD